MTEIDSKTPSRARMHQAMFLSYLRAAGVSHEEIGKIAQACPVRYDPYHRQEWWYPYEYDSSTGGYVWNKSPDRALLAGVAGCTISQMDDALKRMTY